MLNIRSIVYVHGIYNRKYNIENYIYIYRFSKIQKIMNCIELQLFLFKNSYTLIQIVSYNSFFSLRFWLTVSVSDTVVLRTIDVGYTVNLTRTLLHRDVFVERQDRGNRASRSNLTSEYPPGLCLDTKQGRLAISKMITARLVAVRARVSEAQANGDEKRGHGNEY